MARVTVEDCVDKVPNRFELVMLAAHRAREISAGAPITVGRDNDKNPVVSLREIAEETQQAEDLRELETVSQEVLTSLKAEIVGDMPEQMILRHVRLREDSVIKCVALHDANGRLVDSVGERPIFKHIAFPEPVI